MRIGGHLVVDQETLPLIDGCLGRRLDPQTAGNIDGHGLGQVNMEARVDRRLDMVGKEARRRLQRYCLDAALDQLTITEQAGETAQFVDTQGIATFNALQRRGIPSRLLYFPDENHWVLKPNNSILWHETVIDWLDRWVKGKKP